MRSRFDLPQRLETLDPSLRVLYLAHLCSDAIPSILGYFSDTSRTKYRDSVVGEMHTLDVTLPTRSVDAVLSGSTGSSRDIVRGLLHEYLEPIVSLQDLDLEIAHEPAELAFYSTYNLLRLSENRDDSKLALTVASQALSGIFPELLSGDAPAERVDSYLENWWNTCKKRYAP